MERIVTSPFGQRPVTAGLLSTIALAAERPPVPHADKWELFSQLCTGRRAFDVSDRDLSVLYGLLSFLPERTLGDNARLIVFPSNRALSARCHGMAESTLRRHLSVLVRAGLVLRHDSPNGKRYAARGAEGEIVRAFGFDLRPLLVRAGEIASAARSAEAEQRQRQVRREEISLMKRDAQKLALFAQAEGHPGDWQAALDALMDVHRRFRRNLDAATLTALHDETLTLLKRVSRNVAKAEKMGGNDIDNDRLLHNSKTHHTESEPAKKKAGAAACPASNASARQDVVRTALPAKSAPESSEAAPSGPDAVGKFRPLPIPLAVILKAVPDALDFAQHPIRRFADLIDFAIFVHGMMGISPTAWQGAVSAMGPEAAATTVCCILQRIESIRSPGGYLRALTRKAEGRAFSVGPMVMALLQAGKGQS